MPSTSKLSWTGQLLSVQPRIRLWRSFDERAHTYQGYVLSLRGDLEGEDAEFLVAIGKAAQEKHEFQLGDEVIGEGMPVTDQRLEIADVYKASKLKVVSRSTGSPAPSPPWHGPPPPLEVYRERRHRRLDARTYAAKCKTCIWGCLMPVEITIDQWNPSVRKYRTETFCYGPLSCRCHRAGPTRKVRGRRGMVYEEEDWVDAEETSHRGPED